MARHQPMTRARSARLRSRKTKSLWIVIADSQAIDRGGMAGLIENERDFKVVGEPQRSERPSSSVGRSSRTCWSSP
jgi:hypothetical protein